MPPVSAPQHWSSDKESTLYVGNLDERTTDAVIWELMLQAGPIVNVHLPKDRVTQSHQGYGFVEFLDEESAEYAVKIMHQIRLWGKPIRVNKASADRRNAGAPGADGLTPGIGAELFVGNLDPMVDEKGLFDTFSRFGPLLSQPKITRDDANLSKGYGFVSYASFEASDDAIANMHGQYLNNKEITVQYAYKKDGKGERHGDAAERALAAEGKKRGIEVTPAAMPPAFGTGSNGNPLGVPTAPNGVSGTQYPPIYGAGAISGYPQQQQQQQQWPGFSDPNFQQVYGGYLPQYTDLQGIHNRQMGATYPPYGIPGNLPSNWGQPFVPPQQPGFHGQQPQQKPYDPYVPPPVFGNLGPPEHPQAQPGWMNSFKPPQQPTTAWQQSPAQQQGQFSYPAQPIRPVQPQVAPQTTTQPTPQGPAQAPQQTTTHYPAASKNTTNNNNTNSTSTSAYANPESYSVPSTTTQAPSTTSQPPSTMNPATSTAAQAPSNPTTQLPSNPTAQLPANPTTQLPSNPARRPSVEEAIASAPWNNRPPRPDTSLPPRPPPTHRRYSRPRDTPGSQDESGSADRTKKKGRPKGSRAGLGRKGSSSSSRGSNYYDSDEPVPERKNSMPLQYDGAGDERPPDDVAVVDDDDGEEMDVEED